MPLIIILVNNGHSYQETMLHKVDQYANYLSEFLRALFCLFNEKTFKCRKDLDKKVDLAIFIENDPKYERAL